MRSAIISFLVSVAVLAGYETFFRSADQGQMLAVVNYDAILGKLGDSATAETVNAATFDLQQKATKLAAAGFVVIDSRVLVSYPAESEVPVDIERAEDTSAGQVAGSVVDPEAFDEK